MANGKPVYPMFATEEAIPKETTRYELCVAAERVGGSKSIVGVQYLKGVSETKERTGVMGIWRFAPRTEEARIKILADGIEVKGKTVYLCEKNPRREENEGIKLKIFDLPFSYANEAVKRNLEAEEIKCTGEVIREMLRAPDGGLTDWESGDRHVFIKRPEKPIKRKMKMGKFTATLWYKNMIEDQLCTNCWEKGHGFWTCKNERTCKRCLEKGHGHWQCTNEEVCWDCRNTGHRKGDPECEFSMDPDAEGYEDGERQRENDRLKKEEEEKEQERLRREAEEAEKLQNEMLRKRQEEAEARLKAEKLREEELRRIRKEEEERLRKEEEERLRKEKERLVRKEQERLRKEEEDRLKKEEKERLRKAEEERLRKEEEEKLKGKPASEVQDKPADEEEYKPAAEEEDKPADDKEDDILTKPAEEDKQIEEDEEENNSDNVEEQESVYETDSDEFNQHEEKGKKKTNKTKKDKLKQAYLDQALRVRSRLEKNIQDEETNQEIRNKRTFRAIVSPNNKAEPLDKASRVGISEEVDF